MARRAQCPSMIVAVPGTSNGARAGRAGRRHSPVDISTSPFGLPYPASVGALTGRRCRLPSLAPVVTADRLYLLAIGNRLGAHRHLRTRQRRGLAAVRVRPSCSNRRRGAADPFCWCWSVSRGLETWGCSGLSRSAVLAASWHYGGSGPSRPPAPMRRARCRRGARPAADQAACARPDRCGRMISAPGRCSFWADENQSEVGVESPRTPDFSSADIASSPARWRSMPEAMLEEA